MACFHRAVRCGTVRLLGYSSHFHHRQYYTILCYSSTIYHVTLCGHWTTKWGIVLSEDWPHYKLCINDSRVRCSRIFTLYRSHQENTAHELQLFARFHPCQQWIRHYDSPKILACQTFRCGEFETKITQIVSMSRLSQDLVLSPTFFKIVYVPANLSPFQRLGTTTEEYQKIGTAMSERVPKRWSCTCCPLIGWQNRDFGETGWYIKQTQYPQGISGQWQNFVQRFCVLLGRPALLFCLMCCVPPLFMEFISRPVEPDNVIKSW